MAGDGPRVLILDEPTRGIDVGAKVAVHRIVTELAASGPGDRLISSDLPEVLACATGCSSCPRAGSGGSSASNEATEEAVMFAATGQGGDDAGVVGVERDC